MKANPRRRTVLGAGALGAIGILTTGVLTAPRPSLLGKATGDPGLTAALAPHLKGHRRVAVVHLDAEGTSRFAGFGAGAEREFEIGSVSKTVTASLLAQAVEADDLRLKTTVGDVLDVAGSEVADVTLAELATHTSGLPRLSPGITASALTSTFLRSDPYADQDPAELIEAARSVSLQGRGTESYSNFGVALLGQLLAHADGTDYAHLAQQKVLSPLGMAASSVPVVAQNLTDAARRGHTAEGLPTACWTMNGSAPAGGVRSTAADMARYLRGMIDGSAPGAEAATTVLHEGSDHDTAMLWVHEKLGGGIPIIWHNGMTGGYAAFCGWRTDSGEGIVLLTDTARSPDDVGRAVLSGDIEVAS